MLRSRFLLTAALLGALGCTAETFGEGDPVIDPGALVIAEGVPLPGATISLAAPWIAQLPERFDIRIDNRDPVRITGDPEHPDRIALAMPHDLSAGRHELRLVLPGTGEVPAGWITSGGFLPFRSVPGRIAGLTQPIPTLPGMIGLTPQVGSGGADYEAAVLDLRNGSLTRLPGTATDLYGVGAGHRSGEFILYRQWSGGNQIRIASSLGRLLVDSLPIYGSPWPTTEVAPGLYIHDMKQSAYFVDTVAKTGAVLGTGSWYGRPERLSTSPDGRWTVISHHWSADGILLVDRSDRTIHWVPGWRYDTYPLFLPSGQLIVVGRRPAVVDTATPSTLARVDLESGALLDSVVLGRSIEGFVYPAALTIRDWIVIPDLVDGRLVLSLHDQGDLHEIARLVAPERSPCLFGGFSVIEDAALDRFYVTGNYCDGPIPIWTFQPPPALPTP